MLCQLPVVSLSFLSHMPLLPLHSDAAHLRQGWMSQIAVKTPRLRPYGPAGRSKAMTAFRSSPYVP